MRKLFANIISILFIPLFIPTYLYVLIIFLFPILVNNMSPEGKVFFIGYILISTAIVPVIAVLIMNKFGVISEWSMNKRRDRTIPQIFTILVYSFVSYLLVFQIKVAEVLALAMIITTFSVFIITMITFFWKISAHSAGISGIVGILAALQYKYPADNGLYFLLSSIILTGSVMTARMYLHVHTPLQVLLGFLLGLSLSFFSVYFFI